jgi:uncharacterized protein (TIGR03437 family)
MPNDSFARTRNAGKFHVNMLRFLILASFASIGSAANLAISTYLKDGFIPAAVAADAAGNIYIAGSAITDPLSRANGAAVAKIDSEASQYLYFTFLGSAANDQVSAIAVDSAGNAYIAGWTTNPNFPVVGVRALGTAPSGESDSRSFLMKLNPQGTIVFATLLGGSTTSTALGIALASQGRILVSGIAGSANFPVTQGSYQVADSTNQWFLMELDAAASNVMFSATGIGGSSIVLDPAGNIYLAGSSIGTHYPTTPGAYQTTFRQGTYCLQVCQIGYLGNLQHVTKVDPAATKLIYSTGLNDTNGFAGSTTNTGLAVDAAGHAYVTGTLFEAQYPFTVTPPAGYTVFLTKLDSVGASVLFSIPVGGGGVQLDASGSLYIGGAVTSIDPVIHVNSPPPPVAIPSVFSSLPQVCLPNYVTSVGEAYVMKLDSTTGTIQDAQWIDGSGTVATAIALTKGGVWIAGATSGPEVPFSPGALMPQNLGPGFIGGAYIGAVNFPASVANAPSIACLLDSGNMTHVGAVAPFQLISIFGSNLAPDSGVSVTFDGNPAQVLYASPSQINVVIPLPPVPGGNETVQTTTFMQISTNGATAQRQFPLVLSNLNIFADVSVKVVNCHPSGLEIRGVQPLATNADGSINSCANPAKLGSTVSFYMHGAGGFGMIPEIPVLQATTEFCPAVVTDESYINPLVLKVDVSLPTSPSCTGSSPPGNTMYATFTHSLTRIGPYTPVGPFTVPSSNLGLNLTFTPPGTSMPMIVWVAP